MKPTVDGEGLRDMVGQISLYKEEGSLIVIKEVELCQIMSTVTPHGWCILLGCSRFGISKDQKLNHISNNMSRYFKTGQTILD